LAGSGVHVRVAPAREADHPPYGAGVVTVPVEQPGQSLARSPLADRSVRPAALHTATALLVGLAEPVVVLLFQRGQFDAESVRGTSHALMARASASGS